MRDNVFAGRNVLLTGHTGFKGTWMSLMLEILGANIYGYALAPENKFYEEVNPKLIKSYEADINDRESLHNAFVEASPEIVIHFASYSSLYRCYERSSYVLQTNVMGLTNVLEEVRISSSVRTVLIVTSDKCYRNVESDTPYSEECGYGAQEPYSASKACQEIVAECYRNSFFQKDRLNISLATARASNVLGGGDYNYNRLLPSLLDSFINNREAVIRKPEAIRPWQNVLDVLGGYLLLISKMMLDNNGSGVYSSPFNFGPGEDGFVTVRDMATRLLKRFPNGRLTISETEVEKETNILKISSDKANSVLGWRRIYSFEETLNMTADFAIRSYNGETTRSLCEEYINKYLNEVKGIE